MDLQSDAERGGVRYRAELGRYASAVASGLARAERDEVARRIWQRDLSLWPEAKGIERLNWLDAPGRMAGQLTSLEAFASEVRAAGFRRALLLGVGAPYLAFELVRAIFAEVRYLDLSAFASTDADVVLRQAEGLDPATLLVVAGSGGSVETLSLCTFFYDRVVREVGERAGDRFVAVCDPGDALETLARARRFRATFLGDPDLPGCYAALTLCGLLPAALSGVDLPELRRRALAGAAVCAADLAPTENVGVWLGTVLGLLAHSGRDKVTFAPGNLGGLEAWLGCLLAEATGETGLVPVVGEHLGPPEVYGDDRVFVRLRRGAGEAHEPLLDRLAAGHPVLRVTLPNPYDVAGQLFVWQFAAAVAAHYLGADPFARPDAARADARTRDLLTRYDSAHSLPEGASAVSAETLLAFLDGVEPCDTIALQAYLPPSEEVSAGLGRLRAALRERFKVAVTCTFGPQYLYSIGQSYKGGTAKEHVVQLVSEPRRNAPVPSAAGETLPSSFYVLNRARALGDKQALEEAGRWVIQFNLGQRVTDGLAALSRLR